MKTKIYTLSSDRNLEDIRYIGKTKESLKKRLSNHIAQAKRNDNIGYSYNYNSNWINKELRDDFNIIIKEIDFILDNDWEYLEQYWISQFKTWGYKLTNLTEGGDGNKNQIQTEEANKKRSQKLKNIPRPLEIRKKISKSNMGKVLSEDTKEKVRKSIVKLQGRPILQFTLDGDFLKEWECIATAAKFYNVDKSSVMRCCQGKFKKSAGYIWKYKEM